MKKIRNEYRSGRVLHMPGVPGLRAFSAAVRHLFFLLLLLAAAFSGGCGYRIGNMMHPQIKTIGIAPVKNKSREVLAAIVMRRLLAERFMFDGSLKIVPMEKADCIIYCQINDVTQSAVQWEDKDEEDRPSEFNITVSGDFMVLLPGRTVPLVKKRSVSGSCTYQFLTDPAIGKESGLTQACLQMANLIVQYTVEAW
ncbi:MAG: hypothetical protein J6A21_05060 [Lentisphaeria bacterium]|nr:hypothetical protein [Lentisphaeria bacterium]